MLSQQVLQVAYGTGVNFAVYATRRATLPDRLADRPSGRGHQVPSCSPTYTDRHTDMLIKGIHTDRQAGRHCFMLCCLRLTSQVVCLYVTAQLEVVDQHGGKAGGGAEDAAVGH